MKHACIIGILIVVSSSGCAAMMASWREDHCHYDGAYADGMNDARRGRDMNPLQYVGECPVEIEAEVMDGYRTGYTAGASAAPIVEARAPAPDRAAAAAPSAPQAGGQWVCQSTLDCHGHGFCKDRGDGVKLCMTNGSRGDYCTSTIDCAGGLWCKRSGSLEVCM